MKETSEGNTPIHHIQRTRQRRNQQCEGLEECNYQVDPQTGWRAYPSNSQGNLRHPTWKNFIALKQKNFNSELREAHHKSFIEMEELKKFESSTLDTLARRRLIDDRDTIPELTAKVQEPQNEVNCMNDSRDFQDAESVRSGQTHVTSQPAFSHLFKNPGGMLSRSPGMPGRNLDATMGRQVFGTHMIYQVTFLQRRLLQHLIRKSQILGSLMYQKTHHRM